MVIEKKIFYFSGHIIGVWEIRLFYTHKTESYMSHILVAKYRWVKCNWRGWGPGYT